VTESVSVALCTHNGARFVEEQLESILGQTVPVREIVLSDDASTDDTVDRARRTVGDRVPLIVLRNDPPLGVTANFEQAIRATTGDVVVLSDQDDRWRADRVERGLARLHARADAELCFSDARLVGPGGDPLGGSLIERLQPTTAERAALADGDLFDALVRRNLVTGATVLFRRTLLDAARPFPREWVHDEWLAIVAAATSSAVFEPDTLVDYRLHEANVIGMRAPTLGVKVRRVLEGDGGRTAGLARRAEILGERLAALPDRPSFDRVRRTRVTTTATEKARTEDRRAGLAPARWRRVVPVLRLLVEGAYERYTSQGKFEAIRDMLQPR
jgi:glycosyltransferase involved in cell wall biosynthesis